MATSTEAHRGSGRMQVSIRGKWVEVPCLRTNGQTIVVTGRWIKMAGLQDEDWLAEELLHPEECVRALREAATSFGADILRFSQKVPNLTLRYNFPMEARSIAVAKVGRFKEWWESLPQETRKNVRRSQKRGVSIEVKEFGDEVVNGIVSIQNETPVRQGRAYPHFGKSPEQVRRDHGAFLDRSAFICAYSGDEFIGFLKIVFRRDVASILQLNSKIAHYDKRPSNALLARAAELCEGKGIEYLTYGLFNYGNKGWTPLQEFKVRHGFTEMLVPAYYVPLTTWGTLCVKTKLYRGPLGLLPKGVINAALSARSKWYDLRNP
jgi:hypothetical protein